MKIWRNKQIIIRNIKVARLEETVEGRRENNKQVTPTSAFIKELGIKIRNISSEDIEKRPILKDKKGVLLVDKTEVATRKKAMKLKVDEFIAKGFNNIVLSGHSAGA